MIEKHKSSIQDICKTLHVKQLYLFGSGAEGLFKEESDLDFLLSFQDGLSAGEYAENYFALHQKLEELLNRKIDIVTERSLANPFFIESINKTKKLIYDERDQKVSV